MVVGWFSLLAEMVDCAVCLSRLFCPVMVKLSSRHLLLKQRSHSCQLCEVTFFWGGACCILRPMFSVWVNTPYSKCPQRALIKGLLYLLLFLSFWICFWLVCALVARSPWELFCISWGLF